MMTDNRLAEAQAALSVDAGELSAFAVADPFNGNQEIAGYVCRRSDHRYGALAITSVAGKETALQVRYCTPKLNYPFGRTDDEVRVYRWPKSVVRVRSYTKLDGTNVCGYGYESADGDRFVSWKTRLTPVLSATSKWGNFYELWREILNRYGTISEGISWLYLMGLDYTASFEMYGYRNAHLIAYDAPLDASLLFWVRQADAAIFPPTENPDCPVDPRAVPCADLLLEQRSPDGLTKLYEEARAQAHVQNKRISDEQIEGTEGCVFYLEDVCGNWTMHKCKPEDVEALHWAGDHLPESVILPTAWNALESCEGQLTADYVSKLLLEEFSREQVLKSYVRIEKAVAKVLQRLAWRSQVLDAYIATYLSWGTAGRSAVMRAMSSRFPREKMKEVYNALRELGIASD